MKNLRTLLIPCMLGMFLLLLPGVTPAEQVFLTDDQLDQIQGSAVLPFEDTEKLFEQFFQLVFANPEQWLPSEQINLKAIDSAVVLQSNIAFALNFSGEINQTNTAVIFNNQVK
jgi:hypothetical protein